MGDYMPNPELFMDKDVSIKHFTDCVFGKYVAIDKGFYSTVIMDIGDWVHLAPYTSVIGGREGIFKMGHFSGLSAGARVICSGDDFTSGALMNPQVPIKYREPIDAPVIFEMFTCLGTNSVVMPGVTLAVGSVVGASSVLTKNTEPWTIYVGCTAKPVKLRTKYKAIEYARELGYEC